MVTPLDPVIAQIIPLLPLRDPTVMTPQNARDALRALADHSVVIPTSRTDRAQELHLCIQHVICDVVEQSL